MMAIIGSFALFVDSASSLYEVWFALYSVFGGYLVPVDLFPPWLRGLADVLPFRLMLSVPVEAMIGHVSRGQMLTALGWQAVYVLVFGLLLRSVWNAGVRRYAAFGG